MPKANTTNGTVAREAHSIPGIHERLKAEAAQRNADLMRGSGHRRWQEVCSIQSKLRDGLPWSLKPDDCKHVDDPVEWALRFDGFISAATRLESIISLMNASLIRGLETPRPLTRLRDTANDWKRSKVAEVAEMGKLVLMAIDSPEVLAGQLKGYLDTGGGRLQKLREGLNRLLVQAASELPEARTKSNLHSQRCTAVIAPLRPNEEPARQVLLVEIALGGFTYGNHSFPLGGKPSRVLDALIKAGSRGATAADIVSEYWKDEPITTGTIKTHVSNINTKLLAAMEQVHGPDNERARPIQNVARGNEHAAWKLVLPGVPVKKF